MKTIVTYLNIAVNIYEMSVAASSTTDVPIVLKDLSKAVDATLLKLGFVRSDLTASEPSRRNGGWAFYTIYMLETDTSTIKLVVDVRTADHPSRPDLATKNAKRTRLLEDRVASNLSDLDKRNVELVDTYYKQHNWGIQYFISKGDSYSQPIDSLDVLCHILTERIGKLIAKYS